MFQVAPPVIALIVALLPGSCAWWWGRALARRADDPALRERLLANRSRNVLVLAFSLAVLMITGTSYLAWALPLLLFTRMAAAYPLRKALYQETWRLHSYLWFFLRLGFALFGFWILLAALPALAMAAGRRDWIVASIGATVLFIWNSQGGKVLRTVLHARAVTDPAILTRFHQMETQCGLSGVALEQVDIGGGVFANAAALPSLRQPAVVMTGTLAARLEPDEVIAILAHELAHFAYYTRRRLRRMNMVTVGLIAVGASAPPLVRLTAPEALQALGLLWPLLLGLVMILRSRYRQKQETVSDLRAVALAGDPEALVRALVKVHALLNIPRRWDAEMERQASHPSLARRIRDIRKAAGEEPARLGEAAAFTSVDGATSVTFEDHRILWRKGDADGESIAYADLSELRLAARPSGETRLVAADRAGKRRDVRLQDEDIARAQVLLDIVDARLGQGPAPPAVSKVVLRALALLSSLVAVMLGQWPTVLLGWLAALVPASPVVAAAGAAMLAASAVAARSDTTMVLRDGGPWMAAVQTIVGLMLLTAAFLTRGERRPKGTTSLVGLVGACAACAWVLVLLWGADIIRFHRGAREWPVAAVLTSALAAGLAFDSRRRVRVASLPVAIAGVVVAFAGSTMFLDRFGGDPFLVRAAPLRVRTVERPPIAELAVPFDAIGLRLSPSAQFLAVLSEDRDERTTVHAGRWGSPLADFPADEAVFIDEARLLLLERQKDATTLRLIALDKGNVDVWRQRLPVAFARLSIEEIPGRWRVLGWDGESHLVSASAGFDEEVVRDERWASPGEFHDIEIVAASRGDALAVEIRRPRGLLERLPRWASAVRPTGRVEARLWGLRPGGRNLVAASRLDLSCHGIRIDDDHTLCAAYDGTRTHFFSVNPTEPPRPLAEIAGRFFLANSVGNGWVSGWWDYAETLLHPETGEAIRLAENDDDAVVTELAIAGSVLGAVFSGDDESSVRLYSLEGVGRPGTR